MSDAAGQGAKLLVFPEYGSMELASLFGEVIYSDLSKQLDAMQSIYPDWQGLHLALANRFDLLILGASYPVQQEDGRYLNRATLVWS